MEQPTADPNMVDAKTRQRFSAAMFLLSMLAVGRGFIKLACSAVFKPDFSEQPGNLTAVGLAARPLIAFLSITMPLAAPLG